MELGDPTAGERTERTERSQPDVILDKLNNDLAELLETVESGGLDHLSAAEKISFWKRFETFRNRLPLIDHALIADAQATDLATEYCFSNLTMLLTRRLQLSPAEAAARVRAAAALSPRISIEGEAMEPVLPRLAAAQRAGAVTTEQVQIVARAMQKLTRPDLNPEQVAAVEQLLVRHAQELGPKDLRLVADRIVDAADADGPAPIDEPLQQDRRHVELRQRRDGMWQLEGKLTNTVGAQLHAILDPLTRPRPTSIEIDGKPVEIPDERHYGQRMHDGLEDVCGRLLQLADRPATGGTPASVIVTLGVEDTWQRRSGVDRRVRRQAQSRPARRGTTTHRVLRIPAGLATSELARRFALSIAMDVTRAGASAVLPRQHPERYRDRARRLSGRALSRRFRRY